MAVREYPLALLLSARLIPAFLLFPHCRADDTKDELKTYEKEDKIELTGCNGGALKLHKSEDKQVFSFAANVPVKAVSVFSGPGSRIYSWNESTYGKRRPPFGRGTFCTIHMHQPASQPNARWWLHPH